MTRSTFICIAWVLLIVALTALITLRDGMDYKKCDARMPSWILIECAR